MEDKERREEEYSLDDIMQEFRKPEDAPLEEAEELTAAEPAEEELLEAEETEAEAVSEETEQQDPAMSRRDLAQRRIIGQQMLSGRGCGVVYKPPGPQQNPAALRLNRHTVPAENPPHQLVQRLHPHKRKCRFQIGTHDHLRLKPQTAGGRIRTAPAQGNVPGADLLKVRHIVRFRQRRQRHQTGACNKIRLAILRCDPIPKQLTQSIFRAAAQHPQQLLIYLCGILGQHQTLGIDLLRQAHTFSTAAAPSQILPKPEMEVMAARSS